jgi:hypothetical protein
MNKCEQDLEEDALIILEQSEPQGTLYSLKRQKEFIIRLRQTQGSNNKNLECRVESRKYISIENMIWENKTFPMKL